MAYFWSKVYTCTGALISAQKFVKVTWAHEVALKTGRPIKAYNARYDEGPIVIYPSALGGHNWQPTSYNPMTGLVYIPAQDIPMLYALEPEGCTYKPGYWNLGTNTLDTMKAVPPSVVAGYLIAWDPVKQQDAWRVTYKSASNGGTLTTADNLVSQGTADGHLVAYSADNGEKRWEFFAQTGIVTAVT